MSTFGLAGAAEATDKPLTMRNGAIRNARRDIG
jgi:hypothetical protein